MAIDDAAAFQRTRVDDLKQSLALYRLTFGQPRQEELLELLKRHASEGVETAARIGCVFFTPWWPAEPEYKKHRVREVWRLLTTITECRADLWAWCYRIPPREGRGME